MKTNTSLLFLFLLLIQTATAAPDSTVRLLQELTNAHGPSGFEGPVRAPLCGVR